MPRKLHTICSRCSKEKEILQKEINGVIKIRSICKPCHSAISYNSRKKRTEEYGIKVKAKNEMDISSRGYLIWKRAKDRASKNNLDFNITKDHVVSMLNIGVCQATGLKLNLTFGKEKLNPLGPSLDRINPKIGYIVGNVRMVCWIFNRAKGDGSDNDVWLLAEALNAIKNTQAA
jgi:hypothetical protein